MTRRQLEVFAQPSSASKKLLENAMAKMNLSASANDRILKVARTIADLEGAEVIDTPMYLKRSSTATWTVLSEGLS